MGQESLELSLFLWGKGEFKKKKKEKAEEGRMAYCQPDDDVGVNWIASTPGVLLVSK